MVDESVNGQLGGGIFVMPLQIIFSSTNRVFRPGVLSRHTGLPPRPANKYIGGYIPFE